MKQPLGLSLTEKDKQYTIFKEGATESRPVGGLITEYLRIPFVKLREIVDDVPYGDKDFLEVRNSLDRVVPEVMFYFENMIPKYFSHIQSSIIVSDFFNGLNIISNRERRDDMVEFSSKLIMEWKENDVISKMLPDEAWVTVDEIITVRDFFLVLYNEILKMYILISLLLESVMRTYDKYGTFKPEGVDTKANDHIYEFFEGEIGAQDIDYKIIFLEGELQSVYTVNSAMSLLLFDFAHVWKNDTAFVKCRNCGKYFVPVGRADSKYCPYPLADDSSKTCKDVGAQNTRADKEKNDTTTKEYRRIYMKLNMNAKRHPDDEAAQEKLERIKSEIKDIRNKLAHGMITEAEFLEWLNSFDN